MGNSSGVLSRVAGMFSRRGYNIDSLTVGETLNPELSRMTIAVTGEDDVLEQIEKQLNKLIDVKEIVELLEDFNITEIARTGITGLARGSADLNKM